jgi:hypothetical protein
VEVLYRKWDDWGETGQGDFIAIGALAQTLLLDWILVDWIFERTTPTPILSQ